MKLSTPVTSSLAAFGSVLAAASCCVPVGTMWLAATAAGAGAVIEPLRPWLTGLSIGFIALGFWQARRAGSCSRTRRTVNLVLLSVASASVGASVLLPAYWTLGPSSTPAGQPPLAAIATVDAVRARWQASKAKIKILVLLSPT